MINDIKNDFRKVSSKSKADHSTRFFKTGKGEYGEGDLFLGVSTPNVHKLVNKYKRDLDITDTLYFLNHKIHTYRFFALEVLKYKYKRGHTDERKKIFDIYIKNLKFINNWDLVDISAPHIVGDYLLDKDRDILFKLAKSDTLWSQRVAIISTFAFIRNSEYEDTLKISKILLNHKHDLIHKAVGWMLREVWKRDPEIVEEFLKENYDQIPRTALRYSIEKMEEKKRKRFLKKEF